MEGRGKKGLESEKEMRKGEGRLGGEFERA